ncbi:hypothetical protein [Streptomyces flavofungini]|uniref:hypothetical protein n=1 Tax=Streptomyces flavofungini TaxID=68200 RepID=UPI003F814F38
MLRGLVAAAAAAAVVGSAVMRRWDLAAGKQVAELGRARASDEWRHEERIAEAETDLEESRELRGRLETKLRAKRAELAALRNEHAELLRRYATAETERASALEGRRLLAIEAASPAPALPKAGAEDLVPGAVDLVPAVRAGAPRPAARAEDPAARTESPAAREEGPAGRAGANSPAGREEGKSSAGRTKAAPAAADAASAKSGRTTPAQPGEATPAQTAEAAPAQPTEATPASSTDAAPPVAAPAGPAASLFQRANAALDRMTPRADSSPTPRTRPVAAPRTEPAAPREAGPAAPPKAEDESRGKPGAADGYGGHERAVAVAPPAQARRPAPQGGFDFFGTKGSAPAALEAVQNEDLADVVGEEALAVHKAETEAEFKDAPDSAAERGVGQVIDLTAHDETEQIDVAGLRTALGA